MDDHDPRLLLLDPRDNVCAATTPLSAGETLSCRGVPLTLRDSVPLGHKVATVDLALGAKVRKYGAIIGSASQPIRAGEHVHVHNLVSDYLPTFERGDARPTESST